MFGTKLSQTAGSTELTPHRPFWAPSLVSILVYQNARRGLSVGSLATRRLPSPFFTLSRHPDRVADCVSPQVNQTTCFASTPPSCTKVLLRLGASRISLLAPVPASAPALSPFRQINSPS